MMVPDAHSVYTQRCTCRVPSHATQVPTMGDEGGFRPSGNGRTDARIALGTARKAVFYTFRLKREARSGVLHFLG